MLTRYQRDRATHLHLVDQSATRAAARDEAARILADRPEHKGWADTQPGPLTAADLQPWQRTGAMAGVDIDRVHRVATLRAELEGWHNKHPDCTGPCQQGRRLCPCPTACGIDGEERNARPLPWYMAELLGVPHQVITALSVVVGIIAIAGAVHFALR